MSDIVTTERRGLTIGGARLRDSLATIEEAERAAGPSGAVVVYAVFDKDGGEVGAARLNPNGWSVSGTVTAAVREGRLDPGVRVTFRKRL